MADTVQTTLPGFQLPTGKLPSFNLDAFFGLYQANLAATREAQDVLVEAAHAIARLQQGWLTETLSRTEAAFKVGATPNPTAAFADAKSAAERAIAVSNETFELGAAAQRRLADLVAQRATANAAEVKSLIAA